MKKPQLTSYLIVKRWGVFLLRFGIRQGCLLLPLPFNIVLEVLVKEIRQEKEMEGIQTRKEVKLSLPTDNMIFYTESINPLNNY